MRFGDIPFYEIENTYKRETKRGDNVVIEAIEIEEGRPITNDIILKTKSGKRASFSGFLKNRTWKFQRLPAGRQTPDSKLARFACSPQLKLIFYGTLEKDGALLSLLHEIGHANLEEQKKGLKYVGEQGLDPIYKYLSSPENQELTKDDILARGENPRDYVAVPYLRDMVLDMKVEFRHKIFIPKDLLIKYGKLHAENERKSWAFALSVLRKLKQKGIILEETLEDIKSLEKFIYKCLDSYEKPFKEPYGSEMNLYVKNKKF